MLENGRKQKKRWSQNQNSSSLSKNSWGFSWTKIELSMIFSSHLARSHLWFYLETMRADHLHGKRPSLFLGQILSWWKASSSRPRLPLCGEGGSHKNPSPRCDSCSRCVHKLRPLSSFFSWDFFQRRNEEWTDSKPVAKPGFQWFFQEIIQVLFVRLGPWLGAAMNFLMRGEFLNIKIQQPRTSKIYYANAMLKEIPLLWQPLAWNSPNLCVMHWLQAWQAWCHLETSVCFFPVFFNPQTLFLGSQNPDNEIRKRSPKKCHQAPGSRVVQRLGHFAGVTRDRDHAI